MGFLSTKEVIEYSVTDLIGQYAGQTRPKTRRKLQRGLGHVLIINEANQLLNGSFTTEAVDELLQFLTNPDNTGKIVIILSGSVDGMNKLMARTSTLSSHFPEEIAFEGTLPDDCIKILVRELEGLEIIIPANFLTDTSTEDYRKIKDLFHSWSLLPGWNNVRDVQNLAKKIGIRYISMPDQFDLKQELQVHHVTECLDEAIAQRRRRPPTSGSRRSSPRSPDPDQEVPTQDMEASESRPEILTATHTESAAAIKTDVDEKDEKALVQSKEATTQHTDSPEVDEEPRPASKEEREDGVSDEDWERLDKDKDEASYRRWLQEKHVPALESQLKAAEKMKNETRIKKLQDQLTKAQEKVSEEEKIQKTLQAMSPCVAGYTWIRQEGGYRCRGGSHFVSDEELSGQVTQV